ncbi:Aste57867_2393 [Aphanomyces stellatus]|uniref:Aste57867_2393 protein n=1 Tax=Aphanomyces stellatus TaxID=120398 RepID=A0A485KCN2_9STRA|nr:hypothetical protein As57867_002387 [Aphanomyces stellatus]VFT79594.1 Aste57867_2393 [Aphanomyces stellatus]
MLVPTFSPTMQRAVAFLLASFLSPFIAAATHRQHYGGFPEHVFDPLNQNAPADQSPLRPPPPRVPDVFDIFVGISAFRDGVRCGYSLFTAFANADHPNRVFVGVVDQTNAGDAACLDEYCKLAAAHWPDDEAEGGTCKFKDHVRIDARAATASRGPVVARHEQQQLIQDEEFCLQIDAHSKFLDHWDTELVRDWSRAQNEMAVLTTYPLPFEYMGPGETIPIQKASFLCDYIPRATPRDVPVIRGWSLIEYAETPQMSALWGGCLSFSKCHAETRVPVDKHMTWVFWGEEYLRSHQLWTQGYDLYAPSRHGSVVFHNWSTDAAKKSFAENQDNTAVHATERESSYNRLRMMLKLPFEGPVDATEVEIYNAPSVRTTDQFLAFSGISQTNVSADHHNCHHQLHWVPYAVPEIVEQFLPGWHMRPPSNYGLRNVPESDDPESDDKRQDDDDEHPHNNNASTVKILALLESMHHQMQTQKSQLGDYYLVLGGIFVVSGLVAFRTIYGRPTHRRLENVATV